MSVENLLDLVGYNKVGFTSFFGPTKKSYCDKVSHSLSESQVESHISDIRGNVEEAVDGVKKLASLRRYNATHSVLGTRWHRS